MCQDATLALVTLLRHDCLFVQKYICILPPTSSYQGCSQLKADL